MAVIQLLAESMQANTQAQSKKKATANLIKVNNLRNKLGKTFASTQDPLLLPLI